MYVALAERQGRYLQFGAKLGRNVHLHAAARSAEEKLGHSKAAQVQERRIGVSSSGTAGPDGVGGPFTSPIGGVTGAPSTFRAGA